MTALQKRSGGAVVAAGKGGLTLTTTVGVVLIVLKLAGLVGWSWWWVLAPFWIWPAVVVALLLGAAIAGGVAGAFDKSPPDKPKGGYE